MVALLPVAKLVATTDYFHVHITSVCLKAIFLQHQDEGLGTTNFSTAKEKKGRKRGRGKCKDAGKILEE
jgi:hypothetical protein